VLYRGADYDFLLILDVEGLTLKATLPATDNRFVRKWEERLISTTSKREQRAGCVNVEITHVTTVRSNRAVKKNSQ